MLRFLIGIICILLHIPMKLTLVTFVTSGRWVLRMLKLLETEMELRTNYLINMNL